MLRAGLDQRAGAVEVVARVGSTVVTVKGVEGSRVVAGGSQRLAQANERAGTSDECLRVIGLCGQKSVERLLGLFRLAGIEFHSSEQIVHNLEIRLDLPRVPIVRLGLRPAAVDTVQFTALNPQRRILRLAFDPGRQDADLGFQVRMGRHDRRSQKPQKQGTAPSHNP